MSSSAPTPGSGGFLARDVTAPLDQAAHEALTALLRHGTDLLALVGSDARIRYLSPAVEDLLGLPPSRYTGRPVLELVHPDDLAEMTRHLADLLARGGTVGPVECRVVRVDGTARVVELVASDVSDVPGLDGTFVVNSRDITDRRRYQDELASARAHEHRAVERTHRSEAMARDLRVAVEAGGLRVHYQPKVALDADRITGFEALARWQHPTWGTVAPPVFIEVAEEHGIIDDLGRWIMRQAVDEAATWSSPGTDVAPGVAVNISARQFSSDLPRVVADALARSGLAPGRLTLEVTESTVMDDAAAAATVLADLAVLGVRLSIDDFGTGYSSLAQLRRFPLDELKIDKSFVDGLGTEAEDTAIVAAIMAMAHAQDLTVVAEGIEDEQQRAELRRLGAELGQGYLFSRPVPAEAARALAAEPDSPRATGPHPTPTVAPSGADIVVADDAPEVLQLLAVSLAAAGFTTHQATDGDEALAAIRAVRPVATVLDVEMPGLRGPEVCRRLRADPDLAHCTVIVLSAHSSAEDRIEAFRAGADEYVVKPFSPRDIVSRTTAALERRRRVGEAGR